MQWYADWGAVTPCCQHATPDELHDEPRRYDCTTCPVKAHHDALWQENAEAWRIYQALAGRIVGDLELHGWVLDRLTESWTVTEVLGLLGRLNVIQAVIKPRPTEATDGRTQSADQHRRR